MANGQTLAWKELRVGILVVTSVVLLAVAIFYIGGDTGFFTPKYKMTVYFHSADGLHKGALVLVNGVRIGNVSDITLSKDTDTNRAVEVGLQLNKSYHDMIRTDSVATIGTVGVLGDQQVELTRGSPSKPAIEDGGMLQGMDAGDIKQIISNTNDVVANLGVMTSKIGALIDNINNGKGTAGKFLNDTSIYDKTDATVDELHKLVIDAHSGNGSIGRLLSDDEMYQSIKASVDRLNSTLIKVDATVDKISNGNGNFAKFINDDAIYRKTDQLLTTFGNIAGRIDRGEGTLGKLSKEDVLYSNLNTTLNKTNTLLTSVENGEGTLGKMMKDATLYNSLSQTSSEMQKLMYDFRQNPKKYLTINFRLF
jgi:phospholipid/cholesterol/gamma-HCH transport system substrate-binding protein